jgi:hypothetical protein
MLHHIGSKCFLTFIGALTALSISAQTIPVQIVQTTPIIGIAAGQTARLDLLNPGVLPSAIGVTCSATVSFIQGNGTVVKTATLTIAPGMNQYVDVRSDVDLDLVAVGDRHEIRATVSTPAITPVSSTTTTPAPACKLIGTLEIFNVITGQTQVSVGRLVTVPSVSVSTAPPTN